MRALLLYFVFALGQVHAVVDCGHGKTCAENQTCVSSEGNSGHKFGCAPVVNATICDDARFACEESFACNFEEFACQRDGAEVETKPLLHNVLTESVVSEDVAHGGMCAIISKDLPARCNCTDKTLGGTVFCRMAVLGSDMFGMQVDIAPCEDPAHIAIQVTESKHHVNLTVGGIEAGETEEIPIPGLAIGIPHIGNAGLDVAVGIEGDLKELGLSVGVNACVKVLNHNVCGSDLTGALPVWILRGTYHFSNYCNQRSPTILQV
eukprot:TRINITY_DN75008_c0_g1_i1.p1 TRINITY_DN75008_c0_g1~~TRINITY_DN75008_c0_g1_i1.p1  ORF type:complete len:264 (-),score=23.88 TRINITY_DN75008_c0_g1_i1:125-916(-)